MAIERLVEPTMADDKEEERIEISLRPLTFTEYIGQEHLKNNIKLAIEAVKKRGDGSTLDHVLLYGPPGSSIENRRASILLGLFFSL